MAFHNLFFPFVFLPISLLLYYITPKKLRLIPLLLTSLLFFAWGEPVYLVLLVLSLLINYFAGLEISGHLKANRAKRAGLVLWSTVAVDLLLLGFFKYWGFLLENVNALLGTQLPIRKLPVPIGLSFYTFSLLSYLFDVYRQKAPAQKNLLRFGVYVSFFGKLSAGPIVQYHEMERQLDAPKCSWAELGTGTRLFLIGLGKKVLLSNAIGIPFYALLEKGAGELSVLGAWLGAICYALLLYFDFSGYSDMALGIGKLFGFSLPKNFSYPYLSGSITEFWRRWHISLGAWFRDYVYIPLGGSREGKAKTLRNLLIVWLLTGLWHGASWNFILWGLYFGVLLIVEKFVLHKLLPHIPGVLRAIATGLLVLIGWIFFFTPTLPEALIWIGKLFSAPLADSSAKYYLASCWPMLLICLIGCTPIPARLGNRIFQKSSTYVTVASLLFFGGMLLLCIANMMNDTYSSFLYFQF